MSYIEKQLSNVDDYGYPMAPSWRRKLRKIAIGAIKSILARGIYVVTSIVGGFLWLGRSGEKYPPLTPATFHPTRILVIRLDLIGDLVLSLTVVSALKRTYPGAKIDLLALPTSVKVAKYDPNLAEIIPYDPNIWRHPKALLQPEKWRETISVISRLRAHHYDMAISVYSRWAALLDILCGVRRRVSYGAEGLHGLRTVMVLC